MSDVLSLQNMETANTAEPDLEKAGSDWSLGCSGYSFFICA